MSISFWCDKIAHWQQLYGCAHTFYIVAVVGITGRTDTANELHFETVGEGYTIGTHILFLTQDGVDVQGGSGQLLDQFDFAKDVGILSVLIVQGVTNCGQQGNFYKHRIFIPTGTGIDCAKLNGELVQFWNLIHAGQAHVRTATASWGYVLYLPHTALYCHTGDGSDLIKCGTVKRPRQTVVGV